MTPDAGMNGHRSQVPIDAILSVHAAWLERGPAAQPDSAPGAPSADPLAAIREFHRRIVTRPPDEPLILCRGVSCRMHGADELHAALKASLTAAGVLGRVIDVHCLSQCEHGPNMKIGETVLCTGKGCVVTDSRPWRPVSAGPKPVEATAAPPPSAS
jgi:hypothetical protein